MGFSLEKGQILDQTFILTWTFFNTIETLSQKVIQSIVSQHKSQITIKIPWDKVTVAELELVYKQ